LVDDREEPLGDLVEQRVEAHADGLVVAQRRRADVIDVAGGCSFRRLVDRYESLGRRDEIYLLADDAVARDGRDDEHAEDVCAVCLQPGPGLVAVRGRAPQPIEHRDVQSWRERGDLRGFVGIVQICPAFFTGHGARR
jgi:hypothetical protein